MGQIEQLVKSKLLGNDNPNNLVWPITKTQAVYDKTNTDLQTVLDSLGSEIQEIKEINNVSVRYDQTQQLTEEQKETARTNIDAGTYSKPEGGIPASDLADDVYESFELPLKKGTGAESVVQTPFAMSHGGMAPSLRLTGEANATTYSATSVVPDYTQWYSVGTSVILLSNFKQAVITAITADTITFDRTLSRTGLNNEEARKAELYSNQALGRNSTALGAGAKTGTGTGPTNVDIDRYTGEAKGIGAFATGIQTQAKEHASVAEGIGTFSSGYASHAEGNMTKASGDDAHAEGYHTQAVGDESHAEGMGTQARGTASHAEGNYTQATGMFSHAEGHNTVAEGGFSHASGAYTIATNTAETAIGSYNKSNDSAEEWTHFSVGIGSDTNNRKNAFEITNEGNVYIKGIGGYDGTNPFESNPIQDSIVENVKTFASQTLSGSGDVVRKRTMEIVSESQPRCVLFYGQTKNYTALVSVPSANFSVLVCASGSTGVAYDYSDCVDAWGPAEDGHFMMLRFKTGSNLSIGEHDVFVTFLNGNFGDDTVNTATGGIPSLTTPLTVVNYYQKPSTGIPASDLASGVIPTIKTLAGQSLTGSGEYVKVVSTDEWLRFFHSGVGDTYEPFSAIIREVNTGRIAIISCGDILRVYDFSGFCTKLAVSDVLESVVVQFDVNPEPGHGGFSHFEIFMLTGKNPVIEEVGDGFPITTDYSSNIIHYYSKPSTGIPSTDLASAVQSSLSKIDRMVVEYGTGTISEPVQSFCHINHSDLPQDFPVNDLEDHFGSPQTQELYLALQDSSIAGSEHRYSSIYTYRSGEYDSELDDTVYTEHTIVVWAIYSFGWDCGWYEITDDCELLANKVTSLTAQSTDTQYPSAKCVYDALATKQPVIDSSHKLDYALLSNTPTIPTVPAISTDITTDASSNTKTASPKAVKDYVDSKAIEIVTYGTGVSEIPSAPLCYVSRSDVLDIIPDAGGADDQITSEPGVYLTRQDYSDAEENVRYSGIYSYYTFESSASVHRICIITALYNAGDWELEVHDLYSEIHPTVASSQPSGGLLPNVMYNLGTLSGNTTFALASPVDANIVNHYYWTFDTGSTAPTITWPSGLSWFGGSAPTINASKHYEISVLDGIAVAMEV